MKKFITILLIGGVFFVGLALLLQSWSVKKDQKDKMQKVRDAKAEKAEKEKETETVESKVDGKEKNVHGESAE